MLLVHGAVVGVLDLSREPYSKANKTLLCSFPRRNKTFQACRGAIPHHRQGFGSRSKEMVLSSQGLSMFFKEKVAKTYRIV